MRLVALVQCRRQGHVFQSLCGQIYGADAAASHQETPSLIPLEGSETKYPPFQAISHPARERKRNKSS